MNRDTGTPITRSEAIARAKKTLEEAELRRLPELTDEEKEAMSHASLYIKAVTDLGIVSQDRDSYIELSKKLIAEQKRLRAELEEARNCASWLWFWRHLADNVEKRAVKQWPWLADGNGAVIDNAMS